MKRTPHPDMPGKYNNQYPLGDKLVCPICGFKLFQRSMKIQRTGSGWSCEIGENACRQFIIRASIVEQALINAYHALDMYIEGKSIEEIRRLLTDYGIRTKKGQPLSYCNRRVYDETDCESSRSYLHIST